MEVRVEAAVFDAVLCAGTGGHLGAKLLVFLLGDGFFIQVIVKIGREVDFLELYIVRFVIAPFVLVGPHANIVRVAEGARQEEWLIRFWVMIVQKLRDRLASTHRGRHAVVCVRHATHKAGVVVRPAPADPDVAADINGAVRRIPLVGAVVVGGPLDVVTRETVQGRGALRCEQVHLPFVGNLVPGLLGEFENVRNVRQHGRIRRGLRDAVHTGIHTGKESRATG